MRKKKKKKFLIEKYKQMKVILEAKEKIPINSIENFCNQEKIHLRKFNVIPKEHFHLFIKECQFRFNNPKVEKQLEIIYNLAKKKLF